MSQSGQRSPLLDSLNSSEYGTNTSSSSIVGSSSSGAIQLEHVTYTAGSDFKPVDMAYRGQNPDAAMTDMGGDSDDEGKHDEYSALNSTSRAGTARGGANLSLVNKALVASPSMAGDAVNAQGHAASTSSAGAVQGPVLSTRSGSVGQMEDSYGIPGSDFVNKWKGKTWEERCRYLSYYFPVTMWLPKYNYKEMLLMDVLAGLSVGAMLIPQSIAYASIVGLAPLYGLATAFLAMIVYFIFGHSPILSIGPEATTSILISQAVFADPLVRAAKEAGAANLPDICSDVAATITIMTGILTLLFGIFRLGFVDTVFSRPVLSGFIFAVGSLLILDQTPKLLGVTPCKGEHCEETIEKIEYLGHKIFVEGDMNWRTFLMSFFCVSFLFAFAYIKKKYPEKKWLQMTPQVFIVVVLSTLMSFAIGLADYGVIILGDQKGGFPSPRAPVTDSDRISRYLSTAIVLTVLGFVETQLVNKTVTNPTKNNAISANRELIALGITHITSSFFGCYAAFGSLTRTKVSNAAGAGSQITSLVASFMALLTMLFMLPLFKHMPLCVTASIIFYVGTSLLETHELKFTLKTRQWMDFGLNFIMIFVTFFFGVDTGIFFAFAACLLLVVRQQNKPAVRLMGRLKESVGPRNPNGEEEAYYEVEEGANMHNVELEGILIYQIDGPLFFSNAEGLKDRTRRIEFFGSIVSHPSEPLRPLSLKGIIFDLSAVTSVDATAAQVLLEIIADYRKRNVDVVIVKLRKSLRAHFIRAGIVESIGGTHKIFPSMKKATEYLQALITANDKGLPPPEVPNVYFDDTVSVSSESPVASRDSHEGNPPVSV